MKTIFASRDVAIPEGGEYLAVKCATSLGLCCTYFWHAIALAAYAALPQRKRSVAISSVNILHNSSSAAAVYRANGNDDAEIMTQFRLLPALHTHAVTVSVASRTVTVTGPKGTLQRAFKSINFAAQVRGKRSMRVDMWFGNRQEMACLRTVTTHIENMIAGVTKGYTYKMRFAYAHFPINVTLSKGTEKSADGKEIATNFVEVRNFLGERRLRKIRMHDGVTVKRTEGVKDEIVLEGMDLEKVSGSAALIHESTLIRNKDIRCVAFMHGGVVRRNTFMPLVRSPARLVGTCTPFFPIFACRKFLDGLYVSEKGKTGAVVSVL